MNWFRNKRVKTKLIIGFGVMSVLIAAAALQGVLGLASVNRTYLDLYQKHTFGLAALKDAKNEVLMSGFVIQNALGLKDPDLIGPLAEAARGSRQAFERNFKQYRDGLGRADASAKALEVEKMYGELASQQDQVFQHLLAKRADDAREANDTVQLTIGKINEEIRALENIKLDVMAEASNSAQKTFESSRAVLVTVGFAAVGLAVLMGWLLANMISKPLVNMVDMLKALADGDFTRRLDVSGADEVGQMAQAANKAVESIGQALMEVRLSAASVAEASEQLASASQQLASGAQEQASSLEETAASLEEMTSTVKQNADNARQARQFAEGCRDSAEKGGRVVTDAIGAMNEINQASKRIADIITAIDEIAFQTNLLALNAAVEAARAGEQGRGFAVVAAEVRNLAQRSATAAKEIKGLIQDSVRKVENGSELVNRSGRTLEEIVSAVKRVADIVSEIAAASQEQSTGIEQVNKAVLQMDQITQSNSAQTEELASTAQGLSGNAGTLQELVGRFVLDVAKAKTGGHDKRGAARPGSRTERETRSLRAPRSHDADASLANLARSTGSSQPAPAAVADDGGFEEF